MVPANIRYPRNWTRARIFARVEGRVVAGGGIYRYNEVRLVRPYLQLHASLCDERGDMATLLSKAGKDLTVTVLLDALQQTKDFELSMAKKFGASVGLSSWSERTSF